MKQVLVIGADGQLGSELNDLSPGFANLQVTFAAHSDLDITRDHDIHQYLSTGNYEYVINCAAYTAVDKAESEKELAYKVNEEGARLLAEACKVRDVKLIHISTDFVFDGTLPRPYKEDDAVNPLGVYAASKAAGEQAVQKADPDAVIFRTAWLYSSYGANFVKTMRRLGVERDTLNVIYDQIGSPTYARDLAGVILRAIDSGKIDSAAGIYHYTNEGVASWYDFAVGVMRISGLKCQVKPINTFEYPTPAKRPAYDVLDKRRFKEHFETDIPHWYASLEACIAKLNNNG